MKTNTEHVLLMRSVNVHYRFFAPPKKTSAKLFKPTIFSSHDGILKQRRGHGNAKLFVKGLGRSFTNMYERYLLKWIKMEDNLHFGCATLPCWEKVPKTSKIVGLSDLLLEDTKNTFRSKGRPLPVTSRG